MDTLRNKKTGNWGETLVLEHLQARGYQLVLRNYHCNHGEVDLIMLDEARLLTCIEVKTRRSQKFGPAENSVGKKKLQSLSKAMNTFLFEHPEYPAFWNLDLVIVEDFAAGKAPEIILFRSVKIDE